MQKRFEIRQFRESDLDQVINVNRKCLPENYSKVFFLELYKRFPGLFPVAVVKRRVIGYALCRMELGFPDLGHFGFLTKKGHLVSIAVLENHRRKGVGMLLMKNIMKAMEEYGGKECYLEVRVSNSSAILMYKKLGFLDKRRTPRYYRDGEDALVMTRTLPYEGENIVFDDNISQEQD